MTVAALYVQRGGCYWDLPGVDPWDEQRDARLYAGPWPVVAHPPCARWCRLAGIVEHRWGHKKGDDGGAFKAALHAVRTWGGVLEHPAYTDAWAHFGLLRPSRGGWARGLYDPGWVCEVSQAAYGHRARKRTWLYYVGPEPPALDWSEPETAVWISWLEEHVPRERMGKLERNATPIQFRDMLLGLARSAAVAPEEPPTNT